MVKKKDNFVNSQFSQIRKRDGRLVPFDARKIKTAILKAGHATGEFGDDVALSLTNRVLVTAQMALGEETPTVEQIQDVVEEVLLASPFKKTAKAFILYRDQHARNREMTEKAGVDRMDGYLNCLDWKVKENSNMSFSLQGLNHYISSENSKIYWLNKIYTPDVRQAHDSGALHIYDLGLIAGYCVGWDLQELLRCGFRGVPAKVESKPAKHFRVILGQVVNFFYSLQGEAAGALAFSNFDTLLAPFIRYDGLSYDQVKQALQEFVFNINVPTRVGFQTPFTNITLDLQDNLQTRYTGGTVLHMLLEEKLIDYIAMDIKAPLDIYDRLTGVQTPISRIKESVELISGSGVAHEYRTTVVKSLLSPEDLLSIRKLIPPASTHHQQKFRPEHALDPALRAHGNIHSGD